MRKDGVLLFGQENKRNQRRLDMLRNEMNDILVLDVETTGIPQELRAGITLEHEILQLAMIDGTGKVVFEKMFKPVLLSEWPEAESIHGITPDDVRDQPLIREYSEEIQLFIDKAELLLAYNFPYDYRFLRSAGISFAGKRYCDVMRLFAHRHGTKRSDGSRQFVSLERCAEYYEYSSFKVHDAVADAYATLFCFQKLQEEINGSSQK